MVAETLVKEPLTQELIRAGGALGGRLSEQLRLVACFWYYLPESNAWRLHLATPLYHSTGPREIYQRVQAMLATIEQDRRDEALDLLDTTVISDQHQLVTAIRTALSKNPRIGPDFREKGLISFDRGLRFRSRVVDGHYLEEAYIYLMLPPQSKESRERGLNGDSLPVVNGVGELAKRAKTKK